MLNVEWCADYFEQVKQFAKDNNLEENFNSNIEYLSTYAEHGEIGKTRCRLFKDFAPNSFEFVMELKNKNGEYKRWFNGGLIYFGVNENGVSGPQYSVRLNSEKSGWSIHT